MNLEDKYPDRNNWKLKLACLYRFLSVLCSNKNSLLNQIQKVVKLFQYNEIDINQDISSILQIRINNRTPN